MTHLLGDVNPKLSWSMRILEWTFGQKRRTERSRECCDQCSPKLKGKVAEGVFGWA